MGSRRHHDRPQSEFWRDPALPYLVDARSTHLASDPFHLHTHDCLMLSLVEAGSSLVQLRDETRLVTAGVVVVIPPGEPHACNPQPGGTLQYKSLFLHVDWLGGLRLGPRSAILDHPLLCRAVARAYAIFRGSESRQEKDAAHQQLLAALGRAWTARAGTHPPATIAESADAVQLVSTVQQHLTTHLGRVVTLDELAARAAASPYQLLRRFQRHVGLSPHAWQMQRRIELAKSLLAQGLPPAEAALETGFADQSHFHRVFKRHVGATPGQYQLGPTCSAGKACKIVQSMPRHPLA